MGNNYSNNKQPSLFMNFNKPKEIINLHIKETPDTVNNLNLTELPDTLSEFDNKILDINIPNPMETESETNYKPNIDIKQLFTNQSNNQAGGSRKLYRDDTDDEILINTELHKQLLHGGNLSDTDNDNDVYNDLEEQSSSSTSDFLDEESEYKIEHDDDSSEEDKKIMAKSHENYREKKHKKQHFEKPVYKPRESPFVKSESSSFMKSNDKPKFDKPKFNKHDDTSSLSISSDSNKSNQQYGYSSTSSNNNESVNTSDIDIYNAK